MPIRIDHIIAAAGDFPALEVAFVRLGFHVTGGGTHPHLGTRNRIVVLGESYIELLGIADVDNVSPVIIRRLATSGSGWVGFAVQSDDIEAEAAAMRGRQVQIYGPNPGQLVAPNGMARSWRTVTIGSQDLWAAAEPLPFLIQHNTSGEQHQHELAGTGKVVPHDNGAQRIRAVTVAVPDLSAAQALLAHAYNLTAQQPLYNDDALSARIADVPLGAGGDYIRLAQPTADGIVQQRLAATGAGVCAVSVAVTDLDATASFLTRQRVTFRRTERGILLESVDGLSIPLQFVMEQ